MTNLHAKPRLLFSLVAALFVPVTARAHPLHTTYAELTISPDGGTLRAMIRVFADNFGATVKTDYPSASSSPHEFERAAYTYVARRFRLTDARGVALVLGWCGLKKDGSFLWLCVGIDHFNSPGPLQLADGLLQEVFNDQINIVKFSERGRTVHILFSGGDGLKRLSLVGGLLRSPRCFANGWGPRERPSANVRVSSPVLPFT